MNHTSLLMEILIHPINEINCLDITKTLFVNSFATTKDSSIAKIATHEFGILTFFKMVVVIAF